jgi:hypothetical protein
MMQSHEIIHENPEADADEKDSSSHDFRDFISTS